MSLADPTRKMSKSEGENHYVGVFEDEGSIKKKVRTAVTDTGLEAGEETSPGVATLFEILELSCEELGDTSIAEELRAEFSEGHLMYSRLKDEVFDRLMAVLRPIQEKRRALEASGTIAEILADGAKRAEAIAEETMVDVRKMVGLGSAG